MVPSFSGTGLPFRVSSTCLVLRCEEIDWSQGHTSSAGIIDPIIELNPKIKKPLKIYKSYLPFRLRSGFVGRVSCKATCRYKKSDIIVADLRHEGPKPIDCDFLLLPFYLNLDAWWFRS